MNHFDAIIIGTGQAGLTNSGQLWLVNCLTPDWSSAAILNSSPGNLPSSLE